MADPLDTARRVLVVSPHPDDAVLSIGATIAALVRGGAAVRVVTVFAGDPTSDVPASYWDVQRGVLTAAEAAAQRRVEDAAACRELGAEPVWLPFADNGYIAPRDPDEIWAALEPQQEWAEITLLPGWPLSQADHRYTTLLVMQRRSPAESVVFYAELPYATEPGRIARARVGGRTVAPLRHAVGGEVRWSRRTVTGADRDAQRRALGHYRGELENLGVRARWAKLWSRLSGDWLGVPIDGAASAERT